MDIQIASQPCTSPRSLEDKHLFNQPEALGLHPTMEVNAAPKGETFFYRGEHKRVITHGWTDDFRLNRVGGPIVYAVTDCEGVLRYIGRHLADTPIYARWFRRGHIHHQHTSRTKYLAELDAGRGHLTLWSAAVRELRIYLPCAQQAVNDRRLAENLEALWFRRWRSQLWNTQTPPMDSDFDDGSYWENA